MEPRTEHERAAREAMCCLAGQDVRRVCVGVDPLIRTVNKILFEKIFAKEFAGDTPSTAPLGLLGTGRTCQVPLVYQAGQAEISDFRGHARSTAGEYERIISTC